ncbi:MAG: DUF4177 domain-containing protein [Methanomassiliicoccaceae archaeon]|jgi:hypothetical protein|nr:DUF4177 domain-containing protein [Methanomassiliicoccaceae archaeon]
MATYKSEIMRVGATIIKSKITDEESSELDELINKRASEGWEFVTHALMGGGGNLDLGRGILITFRRD